MSVSTKTTSRLLEKTSYYLLYPSPNAAGSCHIMFSSPSDHDDQSLWFLTAVGLGIVGFKVCSDAIEFYQFCAAWSTIWSRNHRRNHGETHDDDDDEDIRDTRKQLGRNRRRRRLEIAGALTTLAFGELLRKKHQGRNGEDEHEHEKRQARERERARAQHRREQPQEPRHGTQTPAAGPAGKATTGDPEREQKTLGTRQRPSTTETTCVVCLADFRASDKISCSNADSPDAGNNPPCRHIFHTRCLNAWLFKHTSCPVCRFQMVPEPETFFSATTTTTTTTTTGAPVSIMD
mmetsp:Transcript_17858/g.40849  ORF Transcript_17858/g.40849 Transcript_17858/m.40849 type:complete len:291 (+) Transcript_17858:241-1113(+)